MATSQQALYLTVYITRHRLIEKNQSSTILYRSYHSLSTIIVFCALGGCAIAHSVDRRRRGKLCNAAGCGRLLEQPIR